VMIVMFADDWIFGCRMENDQGSSEEGDQNLCLYGLDFEDLCFYICVLRR
jgi:hypothetical protein